MNVAFHMPRAVAKALHGSGQGRDDDKKQEVPYTRLPSVPSFHGNRAVVGIAESAERQPRAHVLFRQSMAKGDLVAEHLTPSVGQHAQPENAHHRVAFLGCLKERQLNGYAL